MPIRETIRLDAPTLALNALVWVLGDEARTGRLLALTGLDGDALRSRIGEPALHAAVLDFLAQHEPDLIACADATGVSPADLIAARAEIGA